MKIEAMQELSPLNLRIGGIGAITCSLMGIMSNGLTMNVGDFQEFKHSRTFNVSSLVPYVLLQLSI